MRYTLFVKDGCPYCAKVMEAAEGMGVIFDFKNKNNTSDFEELIRRGGKSQFPYLVDTEKGVEMYERNEIIEYLKSQV